MTRGKLLLAIAFFLASLVGIATVVALAHFAFISALSAFLIAVGAGITAFALFFTIATALGY